MSLIIIIAIIWGASALIRSAREKRAREKAQRIAYEQARIKREMREMRQRANEEVAARIALEREQMRQREVERKQAEWNRKQEEINRKTEERLLRLEQKVRKLDRDIDSQNETLADYYAQLDWLLLQQSGTATGGKEFAAWQNKIVTKTNQIRKAENKIADMKDSKAFCEMQMSA